MKVLKILAYPFTKLIQIISLDDVEVVEFEMAKPLILTRSINDKIQILQERLRSVSSYPRWIADSVDSIAEDVKELMDLEQEFD